MAESPRLVNPGDEHKVVSQVPPPPDSAPPPRPLPKPPGLDVGPKPPGLELSQPPLAGLPFASEELGVAELTAPEVHQREESSGLETSLLGSGMEGAIEAADGASGAEGKDSQIGRLSRGSEKHGLFDASGEPACQPCAWLWKEKGCNNAAACKYCHICPQGELRNRKKKKIARLRSEESALQEPKYVQLPGSDDVPAREDLPPLVSLKSAPAQMQNTGSRETPSTPGRRNSMHPPAMPYPPPYPWFPGDYPMMYGNQWDPPPWMQPPWMMQPHSPMAPPLMPEPPAMPPVITGGAALAQPPPPPEKPPDDSFDNLVAAADKPTDAAPEGPCTLPQAAAQELSDRALQNSGDEVPLVEDNGVPDAISLAGLVRARSAQQPEFSVPDLNSLPGLSRAATEPAGRVGEQQSSVVVKEGEGGIRVYWTVDARKLRASDKVAVSPPFQVRWAPGDFRMMLLPKAVDDRKGGASFRRAKGRGLVQVKCEENLDDPRDSKLSLRLSVWGGGISSTIEPESAVVDGRLSERPRGPIEHDFAERGIFALPKDQEEWDFGKIVNTSQCFTVCLEVLPQASTVCTDLLANGRVREFGDDLDIFADPLLPDFADFEGGIDIEPRPVDMPSNEKFFRSGRTRTSDQAAVAVQPKKHPSSARSAWNYRREVEVLRDASAHENIVTMLRWFPSSEPRGSHLPCLILEAVEPLGQDLFSVLNMLDIGMSSMPLPQWLHYMRQLANALAHLHGHGWLHGDLKPDNILIKPDHKIVLIDFGNARKIGKEAAHESSALHHPPEWRARSESERLADTPSDLWMLGECMLVVFAKRYWQPDISVENPVSAFLRSCSVCISEPVAEALDSLLHVDPAARWTLQEVHDWCDALAATTGPLNELEMIKAPKRPIGLRPQRFHRAPMQDTLHRTRCLEVGDASSLIGKYVAAHNTDDGRCVDGDDVLDTGHWAGASQLVIRRCSGELVRVPEAHHQIQHGDHLFFLGIKDWPTKPHSHETKEPKGVEVFDEYDLFLFPRHAWGLHLKEIDLPGQFDLPLAFVARRSDKDVSLRFSEAAAETLIQDGLYGVVHRLPDPINGQSESMLLEEALEPLFDRVVFRARTAPTRLRRDSSVTFPPAGLTAEAATADEQRPEAEGCQSPPSVAVEGGSGEEQLGNSADGSRLPERGGLPAA